MTIVRGLLLSAIVLVSVSLAPTAHAVPSYARELRVPCEACHTVFPQLNAFGRQFKLNGYMLGSAPAGSEPNGVVDSLPPLSVMLQTAYTALQRPLPDSQNNNFQLPQQASMFVAGRIAPGLGSFVQLTYSQADGAISMDNAELRYARQGKLHGKAVTYGAFLNNNPTMEDPWNSTPAWGFPWAAPDTGPEAVASPLIDGGLAQDVLGMGGYASFAGKLYAAMGLYRSAHIGSNTADGGSESTIDNAAVYWRVAWQFLKGTRSLEVGGYGLNANLVPAGVTGPTDGYHDTAVDAEYEQVLGMRKLVAHGTYIDESQDLTASVLAGDASVADYNQRLLKLDVGLYGPKLAYVLGHRRGHGDLDTVRFGPEAVSGAANGKPNSEAWIAEIIYSPWQNVQLRAQYTAYTKFDGASSNYDGFGRNARDNNALFLNAWFAW